MFIIGLPLSLVLALQLEVSPEVNDLLKQNPLEKVLKRDWSSQEYLYCVSSNFEHLLCARHVSAR